MTNIFDAQLVKKSQSEWAEVLDIQLEQLSGHLRLNLKKCSSFIEDQVADESSFGCHVDFRGLISSALQLELRGILCFDVNWDEKVSVGAYLLYFQDGARLVPNADDESVTYLSREIDGELLT